jgi:hypothetical protein
VRKFHNLVGFMDGECDTWIAKVPLRSEGLHRNREHFQRAKRVIFSNKFPRVRQPLVQHGMLDHLDELFKGKVREKGSHKSREMLDEFGTHEPRAKWMFRIIFCISQDRKKETIAETIENIEAGGGYE